MRKNIGFLLMVGLAACDSAIEPSTRSEATDFPLRAEWSAAVAPVGTTTLSSTIAIKEYLGSRMDVSASITVGAPNRVYQWRIFRGDCSTTTVFSANAAPTGLRLFATIQSYPDIATSSGGTATISRQIAGALDSLTAYSVRMRVAQSQTNWNGTNPVACGNLQRS